MANITSRINAIEKTVMPKNKKENRKFLLMQEAERKKYLIGLELDKYINVKRKYGKLKK